MYLRVSNEFYEFLKLAHKNLTLNFTITAEN